MKRTLKIESKNNSLLQQKNDVELIKLNAKQEIEKELAH
jgi:hypothetical protein